MERQFKIAKYIFNEMKFVDILKTIFKSLYRNQLILVYSNELEQINFNEIVINQKYDIRKGTINDLEHIDDLEKIVPWEFRCHQFDNVQDYFICTCDNRTQHISWIYYRRDPNRIIMLKPNEAEIKYCLTSKKYRGHGIYPAVLNVISNYLYNKGYVRVYVCVNNDNYASIRGIEKAGFKLVGKVKLKKIIGFQISRRYKSKG